MGKGAQAAASDVQLMRIRNMAGIDLSSLKCFEIVDDGTQSDNTHKLLPFSWIGKTSFQVASDSVVDFDVDAERETAEARCNPEVRVVATISSLGVATRNEASSCARRILPGSPVRSFVCACSKASSCASRILPFVFRSPGSSCSKSSADIHSESDKLKQHVSRIPALASWQPVCFSAARSCPSRAHASLSRVNCQSCDGGLSRFRSTRFRGEVVRPRGVENLVPFG